MVKDPKKYEGKTVQISGKCVKVNPNIMNRNWLHIKDGTKDDFDLVITSDTFFPEGSEVTMKATVVLNKDFGVCFGKLGTPIVVRCSGVPTYVMACLKTPGIKMLLMVLFLKIKLLT